MSTRRSSAPFAPTVGATAACWPWPDRGGRRHLGRSRGGWSYESVHGICRVECGPTAKWIYRQHPIRQWSGHQCGRSG